MKERPIYTRERAAGLSAGAYLWLEAGGTGRHLRGAGGRAGLLGMVGRKLPPHGAFLSGAPLIELMVAIAVLAVASMSLGLLISAVVNTSEKTMPLLVLRTWSRSSCPAAWSR